MTRRDVVLESLRFHPPPYVPWAWDLTLDCERHLKAYLGVADLTDFIGSHSTAA